MIFLSLIWAFFKIGLFTVGGGYSMIPMLETVVIDQLGWLTKEELLDFVGVAESTPGPLAINLATFIGSMQGGAYGVWGSILGGICATFGVVLPSFIIIIIIAVLFEKFINSSAVQGFFYGVRPVVVGLVAASAVSLGLSVVFPLLNIKISEWSAPAGIDLISLGIMALIFVLGALRFGKKKIKIHPAFLILISAALGVLLFGVLGV